MVPFPTATTYAPLSLDWRAPKTPIAIISGTGKFTCFKFGRCIRSMHPNESPLKILEEMERGRIQKLLNFWVPPIISGTIKLQTSNFVCISQDRSEYRNKNLLKMSGKVAVCVVWDHRKFSRQPYIWRIARSSLR